MSPLRQATTKHPRNRYTSRIVPRETRRAMSPETSDRELLSAASQGDRAAFEALVQRHHQAVIRFAGRFLGRRNADRVEDIAQQTFISAWRSAGSYEPRAQVLTWLLTITTNLCRNALRYEKRHPTARLDPTFAAERTATEESGPDERLRQQELSRRLQDAIARLPERQRAAILLRHYEELPYNEIANALGISHSAVETLLFRARAALRETLMAMEVRSTQEAPRGGVSQE